MKAEEIEESVKRYGRGVKAWGELRDSVEAAMAASEGLPLMGAARAKLTKAFKHLDTIGRVMADVPALAEDIEEERRISAHIREQAKRCGLTLRYD